MKHLIFITFLSFAINFLNVPLAQAIEKANPENVNAEKADAEKINSEKSKAEKATIEKPIHALVVSMKARAGKEKALEEFLCSALPMAQSEGSTVHWFAAQGGNPTANHYFIFDTFIDEPGREAHLKGKIAEALMGRSEELLVEKPVIEKARVLVSK